MITRIEALAEAIMEYSGYRDPEGALFQARNPGGLKAHAPTVLQDIEGNRVFASMKSGWDALLYDLRVKCSGQSHTALTSQSSVKDLLLTNGFEKVLVRKVINFVRRALQDQGITEETELSFFGES